MKERLISELVTEHAIHQIVHVHRGGRLIRELRTYPIRPPECSVVELTMAQERERIHTHALCRAMKTGDG